MSGLFARHTGRRCRRRWASHGTSTGWAALAQILPASRAEDFTQRRTARPAIRPYSTKDAA